MILPSPEQSGLQADCDTPDAGQNSGTLDLLLDTELPVLVRFGSTKMPLCHLMKLTAGSVIEFGCTPEHPVEVIVNGRVIARGAAVVVQGNYGVRISEITATQDKATTRSALLASVPGEER